MMGGGAGSIADMIARLRENQRILRKRPFLNARKEYIKIATERSINYKKATPQELAAIRLEIKKRKKKEAIKSIIAFVISLIIFCLLLYVFLLLAGLL